MTLSREPGRAKAALHYRRAGEYHELALTLIARPPVNDGATDILLASAGALLYEAAKQCVNAVANLTGRDPQANHEKMAALRTIAHAHPTYPDLMGDSRAAWELHIHADQASLPPDELAPALEQTRRFIADMQRIYRAIAPPP